MSEQLLDELRATRRELLDELRAIRYPDDAAARLLLPELRARTWTETNGQTVRRSFSVRELIDLARLRHGESLQRAICAAVGGLNGRRLGDLLARIEGWEVDGLRIAQQEAGSRRRDGATWMVVPVLWVVER